MTTNTSKGVIMEIKLVQKSLYAFERCLGDRMGFDPVKQGDDFIAAMTVALEAYEAARTLPEPSDEVVRIVAEAMYSAEYTDNLDNRDGFIQEEYIEQAKAAITAYREWVLGKPPNHHKI